MPEKGAINFAIQYEVDGEVLEFDTIKYTNLAGNKYSISNLEYYISDITFKGGKKSGYIDDEIHYIDAKKSSTNLFKVSNIPINNYSRISFNIGLNSDTNFTGSLSGTVENLNMAWPEPMGGGYHFLKLEGHFNDTVNSESGYAMHIGTDTCLIKVNIDYPFEVKYQNHEMILTMNINEWFSNPNLFNLDSSNYTMGSQLYMTKISENGVDVFNLK